MVLVKDIMNEMESWAPGRLKESWDNVGLQVGDPETQVSRVTLALSPTYDVITSAVEENAQLLLTHHPLIFKGPTSLRYDTAIGHAVHTLIKSGVAHFCAHTNLDIAQGGVNDVLAQILGIASVKPLVTTGSRDYYKLITFIPLPQFETVRQALFAAGAGQLGHYSGCSWSVQGTGTFLPMSGAEPHIGSVGSPVRVPEYRLEVLVAEQNLKAVIAALQATHPYEEVAFDVFREVHAHDVVGIGRIGELPSARSLGACLRDWKRALGTPYLTYHGDLDRQVRGVAVCGGSAAGYLAQAAQAGADVFVTGDVKYHDAQLAQELGIALVDGGHYATERPVLEHMKRVLSEAFEEVQFMVSAVEKDLLRMI